MPNNTEQRSHNTTHKNSTPDTANHDWIFKTILFSHSLARVCLLYVCVGLLASCILKFCFGILRLRELYHYYAFLQACRPELNWDNNYIYFTCTQKTTYQQRRKPPTPTVCVYMVCFCDMWLMIVSLVWYNKILSRNILFDSRVSFVYFFTFFLWIKIQPTVVVHYYYSPDCCGARIECLCSAAYALNKGGCRDAVNLILYAAKKQGRRVQKMNVKPATNEIL